MHICLNYRMLLLMRLEIHFEVRNQYCYLCYPTFSGEFYVQHEGYSFLCDLIYIEYININ